MQKFNLFLPIHTLQQGSIQENGVASFMLKSYKKFYIWSTCFFTLISSLSPQNPSTGSAALIVIPVLDPFPIHPHQTLLLLGCNDWLLKCGSHKALKPSTIYRRLVATLGHSNNLFLLFPFLGTGATLKATALIIHSLSNQSLYQNSHPFSYQSFFNYHTQ